VPETNAGHLGQLLALGLIWFIAAVVVPVWQVRQVVKGLPEDYRVESAATCAQAVERLGGKDAAARKLAIYLRMPERIAPFRGEAVFVLAATGEAGIPAMIRNIGHPSMEVSSAVLWRMCQGHPSARLAIPRLMGVAQGADTHLALSAIIALGKCGAEAGEAVPALLSCLQHGDSQRRRYAAQALGLIGDRRAVGPLQAATADQEEEVRSAAQDALERLGASRAHP